MNRGSRSRGQANLLKIAVVRNEEIERAVVRKEEIERQPKRRRASISATLVSPIIPSQEIFSRSARDSQMSDLFPQFCAIEKVLNTLIQKKRVADWDTVRDGALRLSGSDILLSDVSFIMEIYPEAYFISWRIIDAERGLFELCFKLPNEFVGKLETRSNIFRLKLEEWCSINPGDHAVVPRTSYIPAKPDISSKVEVINKTSKCTVSFLASAALERRNAEESNNLCAGISGAENLARMREMAIMREKTKDIRETELLDEKVIIDNKNRILSLPLLCDALRSKCLAENRTRLKTSDLLRHLISELYLTQKELSHRLLILTTIVPEFITLVPADDIVSVSTVRLDLKVPYGIVRKKVLAYSLSTSRTLTPIIYE